ELSVGLAIANDLADEVEVVDKVALRKFVEKFGALAELGLEDHGQLAIFPQRLQVKNRQPMQALARVKLGEISPRGLHEGNEGGVDHPHEDLFLVFEIKINGAVCDIGAGGDVRDVSGKVSVAGEDGDGGLQNAIPFFTAAGGLIDRMPGDVAAAFAARWSRS